EGRQPLSRSDREARHSPLTDLTGGSLTGSAGHLWAGAQAPGLAPDSERVIDAGAVKGPVMGQDCRMLAAGFSAMMRASRCLAHGSSVYEARSEDMTAACGMSCSEKDKTCSRNTRSRSNGADVRSSS